MKLKIEDCRLIILGLIGILGSNTYAQTDTLNRSVTVERDFQPTIQAAGKISTKPAVIQTQIDATPVEYSEYTAPVTPETSFNPLLSQPTRFEPGKRYNGHISGAIGHPNTFFDFGYHLDDGKKSILDVYAKHHAEWGLAALSKSKLGLNFTHTFSTCDLYFGVNGGNIFYHKYGHFYDYSQQWGMWEKNKVAYANAAPLGPKDQTALWTAEAYLGIKANAKQEFQYQVQTGYQLFAKIGAVAEHQVRTKAAFDWHAEEHHVGANVYVQNNFLQVNDVLGIPDSLYRNRHNFRIEPYYAYEGRRVRIHLGVNLDLNLGHGQLLSGSEQISFAPSPHINFEAQVAKQWLTIYADVVGSHGFGTLQGFMEENRYRLIHAGIVEPHHASYTPVDGELGFHIRPYRDLLIELHGGYAYMIHEDMGVANTSNTAFAYKSLNVPMAAGDFSYKHVNYQRGKIGGQINYHYRDIVRVNVDGDYYIWKGDTTVYDRPNWELGVRIDGRIDKHWSLYSDNHFAGSRLAATYDGATDTYTDVTLKPIIDLNLGLQYDMWVGKAKAKGERLKVKAKGEQVMQPEAKPNLSFFFQLNNWLHRKNEYYYGYRSQGINFLLGVTYKF